MTDLCKKQSKLEKIESEWVYYMFGQTGWKTFCNVIGIIFHD